MPNPEEALQELIDPSLGGDYPMDSVLKVRDAEINPTTSSCSAPTHIEHAMLIILLSSAPDSVPCKVMHARGAKYEAYHAICGSCSYGAPIQGIERDRESAGTTGDNPDLFSIPGMILWDLYAEVAIMFGPYHW